MKTNEEYIKILDESIKIVEDRYPNYKMISDRAKFASMFSKCLPNELTYEDISILCFFFHRKPDPSAPIVQKVEAQPEQTQ